MLKSKANYVFHGKTTSTKSNIESPEKPASQMLLQVRYVSATRVRSIDESVMEIIILNITLRSV